MKTSSIGSIISQAIVALFTLFISAPVSAEALAPILTNELYTGGPGNQYGVAITSTDEALYTTITDLAVYQNRITKYSLPLSGSPAWSFQWPGGSYSEQGWLYDILVTEEGIYCAGTSYCLTNDYIGDKESKAILVKFPLDGPTGSGIGGCEWYVSPKMFPSYDGGEGFSSMLLATEQGIKYLYITGWGQANWGGSVATLSKYDMAGNKLWWYPLGDTAYGKSSSAKVCNSIIDGNIYVSGLMRGTWSGDSGSIGYIWVRDTNGVALPTISYQEAGKGVCFTSSYYDGQSLYVAGHINPGPSGGQDVLVMKYLPDGTVVWQKTWGGANNESARDIYGKNGDLYIAGSTSSFGSGAEDVFLLQVSSADGAFKNQSFTGGSLIDMPMDLTFSGSNLYTNGYTASTSANGNTPGQYEAMLLSYLLSEGTTPPIGDAGQDISIHCDMDGMTTVQLDGSGSTDPDNDPLTYLWSWTIDSQSYTANGVNPTIQLPLGTHEITLIVNDSLADSQPDVVVVTVYNTPPVANAGPDQIIEATAPGTIVSLDGSASSDPDGDALVYRWVWAGGSATGVSPTIELPVGVHTIQLIVNDGLVDSAPDDVIVTVIAPVKGTLKITPRTINRKSNQPEIRASIKLPGSITKNDVDLSELLVLYPGEIKATSQKILPAKNVGQEFNEVVASFNKTALMNAVPTDGDIKLKVVVKLKSGQYIYGEDTIRVIH